MNKTRVSDTIVCENDNISELLSFLKYSFRSEDFNKAERILRSREEKMKHEKEAELKRCMIEMKGKGNLGREAELMKELEVSRNQFSELCKEFEKKKKECAAVEVKVGDLKFRNIAVEEELKEYKRKCGEMKERVTRVEEDRRVVSEREKRAQERIYVLSEQLEMMEREGKKIKIQVKTEIRDLECGRRRAEEEVEVWKKNFGELETRICGLEEEAALLRCIEDHFCGKLSDESGGLPDELSNEAQVRKDRIKATISESQPNGGINGTGLWSLQINENMMNTNENVPTSDIAGLNTRSPAEESRGKHIAEVLHKREKLAERIIAAKQGLEVEVAILQGKLQSCVKQGKGSEEDAELKKEMDELRKTLKAKEEELGGVADIFEQWETHKRKKRSLFAFCVDVVFGWHVTNLLFVLCSLFGCHLCLFHSFYLCFRQLELVALGCLF